jgi:hypothetical protein
MIYLFQSAPSVEGASPPDQNKDEKEENKDGVVNGEQQ